MPNSKISALTFATTPLAGTETLPVVQSGTTKQVSVANLTAGRAVSASSLALTTALPVASGGTGTSTTFTTGSVVFAGASGVYSQNNGQLFWDNSNTRLGIRTASPAQALDVNGVGRFGELSTKINIGLNGDSISSDGDLYIQTSASKFLSLRTNFTEAIRLETNQDVKITNGNLIQGTAAKGINFTANTGAANMTSQLLNWYEEGTWTPVPTCSGQTITTTSASGTYTRIGRMVIAQCAIIINTVSGAAGGATHITGLPFSNGGPTYSGQGSLGYNDGFAQTVSGTWVDGTTIYFRDGARSQGNDAGGFSAGGYINLIVMYFV